MGFKGETGKGVSTKGTFWGSYFESHRLALAVDPEPRSPSCQELMCLTGLPVYLPQTQVPGNATSATLGPLSSSTKYTVRVTCFYFGGGSSMLTGHVTTSESVTSRLGGAGLCPYVLLKGLCWVSGWLY